MQIKRSGISDVITSLILILTTVSLATVFFFWALGYMGQSQSATAAGINQNNGKVQEQFAVNQVRFWSSTAASSNTLVTTGDMVTVYIRNFGDIPITIDHLYFNGVLFQACSAGSLSGSNTFCFAPSSTANCISPIPPSQTIASQMATGSGSALVVSARAVGCISIPLTYYTNSKLVAWNVGDTDTIEVASVRGNQFTQSFTVPTQNFG